MNNANFPKQKTAGPVQTSNFLPIVLLLLVGSMIALSVSLSKLVAEAGAPILWLVSLAQGGAGLVVLGMAAIMGQLRGYTPQLSGYVIGAGLFLAVPTALGFLAVGHVGAGFMSLIYAFPVLITYALAVALGMERLQAGKTLGVACGLAGGVLLALSKFQIGRIAGWLAAASLIPLIIAVGNIYRTRYWPQGVGAIFLAALTLIVSGVLLAVLASVFEAGLAHLLWQRIDFTLLLLANLAVFAVQFAFYFMLQRIAGPTYLSQIGVVGAVLGVGIAFAIFGEAVPPNFLPVLVLIISGVALFQYSIIRTRA